VAGAAVAVVEGGRVEAVQPLHPVRELGLAALDHEVEVVAHQAVGVAAPAVPVDHAGEELEKEQPVVVVHEDRPAVDAARREVPDAVAERRPQRTSHDGDATPVAAAPPVAETNAFAKAASRASPGRVRCRRVVRGRVQGLALAVSPAATADRDRRRLNAARELAQRRETRRATSDGATA
jgi:hypothetical protein